LEATGPTAKELLEWRNLAKRIALPATASAAPLLVLFGNDYVLGSVHIFVTAVVLLRVREICARSLNRSVDDRQFSDLTMKYNRLPKIMVRAVWHRRFRKEKMRELSCHDSEVIALPLDLLDCRQAFK
jgi:hypothetical protein